MRYLLLVIGLLFLIPACTEVEPTQQELAAAGVIPTTEVVKEISKSTKCVLTGGEVVEDGWSGKDTGSNSCNQCRCMKAGLACTKMACHQK